MKSSFVFLTRDLTAVKLEPQRDAVLPRLRSDSYEAGEDRLRDPIENHLRGVCVGVENLYRERKRWDLIFHIHRCRVFSVFPLFPSNVKHLETCASDKLFSRMSIKPPSFCTMRLSQSTAEPNNCSLTESLAWL